MEQTNLGRGQQPPSQPRRRTLGETKNTREPISLNPALFIPITTFPPPGTTTTKIPLTTEEQLQVLISNLSAQQETVRQNMIIVATLRVRDVRKAAQAELDALPDSDKSQVASPDEKLTQEVEEAVRKMHVRARVGATSKDFEVKPTSIRRAHPPASKPVRHRENGKIVTATQIEPRTAPFIRRETAQKVQDVIEDSLAELEAYEARSKSTVDMYRERLERERTRLRNPGYGNVTAADLRRSASVSANASLSASPIVGFFDGGSSTASASGGTPRGILSNAHEQTPLDRAALDRMNFEERQYQQQHHQHQPKHHQQQHQHQTAKSPTVEETPRELEREAEAKQLAELEATARAAMEERMARGGGVTSPEERERADLEMQATVLRDYYGRRLGINPYA